MLSRRKVCPSNRNWWLREITGSNPDSAPDMRCSRTGRMEFMSRTILMTIGLLQAAEEMGLSCPDDFGLVSFDDYPWLGVFRPRLTTVELPKHQLGSEAAELLIERIGGSRKKAVVRKLQPELRIRESCGFALHVGTNASERSAGMASSETLTGTHRSYARYDSLKSISTGLALRPWVFKTTYTPPTANQIAPATSVEPCKPRKITRQNRNPRTGEMMSSNMFALWSGSRPKSKVAQRGQH